MVLLDDENNSSSSDNVEESEIGRGAAKRQNKIPTMEQPTSSNQHANPNQDENNPEILLNMLIQALNKLWLQIKQALNFIMVDLGGYRLFDALAQWCLQHPQMAICILAGGLVTFLPLLLFLAFAFSTILMTFTGFLVLEGTLLTILTMMMFGLLGALVIMLLFFALVGFATYFGVSQVYDMYGSTESLRTTLRNLMQNSNSNQRRASSGNTNHNTEYSRHENVVH